MHKKYFLTAVYSYFHLQNFNIVESLNCIMFHKNNKIQKFFVYMKINFYEKE